MIVPYGCLPGFNLNAIIREIAAHYNVPPSHVRHGDGRKAERIALARHAVFWKLTVTRDVDAERVAQWLNCTAKTVREGARLHADRMAEFNANSGLKGEKVDA